MLTSILKYFKREKKMETKKVIFIVEATVQGEREKEITKKIRAVRSAVKIGVNSLKGVKATRIYNKDK